MSNQPYPPPQFQTQPYACTLSPEGYPTAALYNTQPGKPEVNVVVTGMPQAAPYPYGYQQQSAAYPQTDGNWVFQMVCFILGFVLGITFFIGALGGCCCCRPRAGFVRSTAEKVFWILNIVFSLIGIASIVLVIVLFTGAACSDYSSDGGIKCWNSSE